MAATGNSNSNNPREATGNSNNHKEVTDNHSNRREVTDNNSSSNRREATDSSRHKVVVRTASSRVGMVVSPQLHRAGMDREDIRRRGVMVVVPRDTRKNAF